jgi:hypothetical protein
MISRMPDKRYRIVTATAARSALGRCVNVPLRSDLQRSSLSPIRVARRYPALSARAREIKGGWKEGESRRLSMLRAMAPISINAPLTDASSGASPAAFNKRFYVVGAIRTAPLD